MSNTTAKPGMRPLALCKGAARAEHTSKHENTIDGAQQTAPCAGPRKGLARNCATLGTRIGLPQDSASTTISHDHTTPITQKYSPTCYSVLLLVNGGGWLPPDRFPFSRKFVLLVGGGRNPEAAYQGRGGDHINTIQIRQARSNRHDPNTIYRLINGH